MIRRLLATTAIATIVATGAYAQDAGSTAPATAETGSTTSAGSGDMAGAGMQGATGSFMQSLSSDQYLASSLTGASIYASAAPDAATVGEIQNFLIDSNGKIVAAITDATVADQSKTIAIPFDQIQWTMDQNGSPRAVLSSGEDALAAAPAFTSPGTQPVGGNDAGTPASTANGTAAPSADTTSSTQMQASTDATMAGDGAYPTAVGSDQYLTQNLIGADVHSGPGDDADNIGGINDLVLAASGNVVGGVVGVGGFLGIGEKDVAVPFDQFQMSREADGTLHVALAATREELEQAPAFSDEQGGGDVAAGAGAAGAGAAAAGGAMDSSNDTSIASAESAQDEASDMADTAGAAAENAGDRVAQSADNTGEAMGNAADATKDAASNAADATGNAVDNAADQTGQAADDAGDAILRAAEATQNAASDMADTAGAALDNAADSTRAAASNAADAAGDALDSAGDRMAQSTDTAGDATSDAGAAATGAAAGAAAGASGMATSGEPASAGADATASTGDDAQAGMTAVTDQAQLTADNLLGATVTGPNNTTVGDVGDIVLSPEGQIDALIVDVGGFLGIGEKPVAVAMDNLTFMQNADGDLSVTTRFTEDQLNNAPEYNADSYADNRDTMRLENPGMSGQSGGTGSTGAMAPSGGTGGAAPGSSTTTTN